jgi:hypothetical protein
MNVSFFLVQRLLNEVLSQVAVPGVVPVENAGGNLAHLLRSKVVNVSVAGILSMAPG